jgi:hypothetical protein
MFGRIMAGGVLAALLLLLAGWYWWFRRCNRLRGTEALRWIERAIEDRGRIAAVRWVTASRFRVELDGLPAVFRHASIQGELLPRQAPLHWLLSWLRRQRETLRFEADLDAPPHFNLEVHHHRCWGARQRLPASAGNWQVERLGPLLLTTRHEWQGNLSGLLPSLAASRACDVLTVSFRRTSPHFSVTAPLEMLAPVAKGETAIVDVLRELATGAASAKL